MDKNKIAKAKKILKGYPEKLIETVIAILILHPQNNKIGWGEIWLTGRSVGLVFNKSQHWIWDCANYRDGINGIKSRNIQTCRTKGYTKGYTKKATILVYNLLDILSYLDKKKKLRFEV